MRETKIDTQLIHKEPTGTYKLSATERVVGICWVMIRVPEEVTLREISPSESSSRCARVASRGNSIGGVMAMILTVRR